MGSTVPHVRYEKTVSLPKVWVRNVMHCVETMQMSVLWNGKQLEWFKPTRGIRQGDAISLYLFVLCMERLGRLIDQAIQEGRWSPIRLSRHSPNLSHLFFADDLLLFAEASESQIGMIMECLNNFCLALGQRINL